MFNALPFLFNWGNPTECPCNLFVPHGGIFKVISLTKQYTSKLNPITLRFLRSVLFHFLSLFIVSEEVPPFMSHPLPVPPKIILKRHECPTKSGFLKTRNPLRIFTHIQFSVVFDEKFFSGILITLCFFLNKFLWKRYKDNHYLKPDRIYCDKIQWADDAIRYSREFLAGEKLVFRDSRTKYYSIIPKINCFVLHLHNSLLQWDKMRTVAQSNS